MACDGKSGNIFIHFHGSKHYVNNVSRAFGFVDFERVKFSSSSKYLSSINFD